MTDVDVIPVQWVGAPVVGPSVSVFHCADGDAGTVVPAIASFFNAIKGQFPPGLQWTFPNSGDVLDEPSGDVTGVWTIGSTPAPVAAGGTGSFSLGVGGRVVWSTNDFIGGRRVKGATFLAPLQASSFEGAGALVSALLTAVNSAAAALIVAAPTLCIYTRKTATHTGSQHPITSGQMPDAVSWLRSRRT